MRNHGLMRSFEPDSRHTTICLDLTTFGAVSVMNSKENKANMLRNFSTHLLLVVWTHIHR